MPVTRDRNSFVFFANASLKWRANCGQKAVSLGLLVIFHVAIFYLLTEGLSLYSLHFVLLLFGAS